MDDKQYEVDYLLGRFSGKEMIEAGAPSELELVPEQDYFAEMMQSNGHVFSFKICPWSERPVNIIHPLAEKVPHGMTREEYDK